MHWFDKHAPRSLSEFAGNPSAIERLARWAKAWKPGASALLLAGPPGVGKTTAALLVAREMEWETLEMNSSDLRDRKSVERVAGLASVAATFSGNRRLIFFDEVDGMFRQDHGGAGAVLQIIKASRSPVILTANDAWARPLASIRAASEVVEFKKIHSSTIAAVLGRVCRAEGVKPQPGFVEALAKREDGDLKAALNDLQALAAGRSELALADLELLSPRDKHDSIFNALRDMFKSESFTGAKKAFDASDEDPDMFMRWVEENIPREYSGKDVASAFDSLARADVFRSAITRRQAWSLMKFQLDLMTAGVALAKEKPYATFTQYHFPSMIRSLSDSKGSRAVRDGIAAKIGARLHAGQREVVAAHLPYFRELFAKDPVGLAAVFGFDEHELQWLGLSEESAKKTVKDAGEMREKAVVRRLAAAAKGQKTLA
jgi:replication factor C large subunit